MNIRNVTEALQQGKFDSCLQKIYLCQDCTPCRIRFLNAVEAFQNKFDTDAETEIALFSAPGRTELGGNHTDHQGGHVLAGSLNTDMIAVVSENDTQEIRIHSEGMEFFSIHLSNLNPQESEKNTSKALLRGIAARFAELGKPLSGFDAYISSEIPQGAGMGSSAAFEVLIGTICSSLFADGSFSPVQIAQIGQFAETNYFGKPCGLMDQLACAVGGMIAIDFHNSEPEITKLSADFQTEGYAVCILESGADHAGLVADYASIPEEMKSIAKMFSKESLSQITKKEFQSHIAGLRRVCGDRAILRAIHFFDEDERVLRQIRDLEEHNMTAYLEEVKVSGLSSFRYLQNVSIYAKPEKQEVTLTIALCEHLLNGQGAVRIHGGGFAGTVQAYVPLAMLDDFTLHAGSVLGVNHCHICQIRSIGSTELTI